MVKIGDGFTSRVGSDSYPYTVVHISAKNRITVLMDDVKRIPNSEDEWGDSRYDFTPVEPVYQEDGIKNGVNLIRLPKSKDIWVKVGSKIRFKHGIRSYYRDPHF